MSSSYHHLPTLYTCTICVAVHWHTVGLIWQLLCCNKSMHAVCAATWVVGCTAHKSRVQIWQPHSCADTQAGRAALPGALSQLHIYLTVIKQLKQHCCFYPHMMSVHIMCTYHIIPNIMLPQVDQGAIHPYCKPHIALCTHAANEHIPFPAQATKRDMQTWSCKTAHGLIVGLLYAYQPTCRLQQL